jgi:hypothetical protein
MCGLARSLTLSTAAVTEIVSRFPHLFAACLQCSIETHFIWSVCFRSLLSQVELVAAVGQSCDTGRTSPGTARFCCSVNMRFAVKNASRSLFGRFAWVTAHQDGILQRLIFKVLLNCPPHACLVQITCTGQAFCHCESHTGSVAKFTPTLGFRRFDLTMLVIRHVRRMHHEFTGFAGGHTSPRA